MGQYVARSAAYCAELAFIGRLCLHILHYVQDMASEWGYPCHYAVNRAM